ncbi:MAG: beta-phosphoglucomutase [Phycisphaerales bacterium]|nr:beta-phosphoglucomutase [Phycisphaerales bacterium]
MNQPIPSTTPLQPPAVIFDLDGVLTDTAELHYRSWIPVAAELGVPFDRTVNDRLRGLARPASLAILAGDHFDTLSTTERHRLMDQKNAAYLALVDKLGPQDAFPGAATLLSNLRAAGARLAVASSSRNARQVLDRLGLRPLLDTVVDANEAERSKPDPQVFQAAATALDVPPCHCVVVEDAAAGVAAGRAAGMRVVGIGPPQRLTGADLVVATIGDLHPEHVLALVRP